MMAAPPRPPRIKSPETDYSDFPEYATANKPLRTQLPPDSSPTEAPPPRPPRNVTERTSEPDECTYDVPRPGNRPVERTTFKGPSEPDEFAYEVARPWSQAVDRTTFNGFPPNNAEDDAPRGEVNQRRPSPLTLNHSIQAEDDKIKVVLELMSRESGEVESARVPMRLLCLFDVSGSMNQKCGTAMVNGKRETKLQKMRNVAKILTETLDDTDRLGILGFGGEVEVLWPLTENDSHAKEKVLSRLEGLGKDGLSLTTNLSQAMTAAIDMFRQDNRKHGVQPLSTRDSIVILTDGDINDGVTDGQTLVREVRQAIRKLEHEGNHYSKDPSLTVSTVVTGNNVSQAVYMLSKTCGSDAYYFIDKNTDTLELGAIIPVMLRKNSAASSISVKVDVRDPAELLPASCSHEYMAHRPHETDEDLNYFLHDIGLGMSKHVLVVLDKESVLCETNPKSLVLKVEVACYDRLMEKHTWTYKIPRGEFTPLTTEPIPSVAVSIQDIRRISQIALRDAADFVKNDKPQIAASLLLQSQFDVQKEAEKFAGNLGNQSELHVLTEFVRSVTENLGDLMLIIEDSQCSTGEAWSTAKALSSAIVREAPSAPKVLIHEKKFNSGTQPNDKVEAIKRVMEDHYSRQGVRSTIFFDFDVTMTELYDSLQRGIYLRAPATSTARRIGGKLSQNARLSNNNDYIYSTELGD